MSSLEKIWRENNDILIIGDFYLYLICKSCSKLLAREVTGSTPVCVSIYNNCILFVIL